MSEMKKEEPREMNLVPTEKKERRTEFSKTYTVAPGKYQAFTSVIPLHRKNKETGKWDELDATFKAEKESDTLKSVGAQLTVSCGASGEKAFIAVKDQEDHRLAWGYEEAEAVKPEAVKEEVKEEDHVLQAFFEAMANAQGTVRYSEIFPGVDMICRNDSRFKDEFIYAAPEFARNIVCRLESNGLELSAEENGTIVAFDTDGKKIYNIPAPTLTDSEGQDGMVQVSLEEMEDGYRLIYEPDPEFMGSAVYPVVLDPYIRTYNQDYAIVDTYVRNLSPNTNFSVNDRIYAARTNNGQDDIRYGLLKVESLPFLAANHYIIDASLVFQTVSATGNNPCTYMREALDPWTASTVTWNNGRPSYSDLVLDYSRLSVGRTEFHVTSLVKKWYQGEPNYGVVMTCWEQMCSGAFYSSDSGVSGKPYLKVEYASLAGLEDYITYDSVSAGKAGTGSVSLVNGNLVFTHSDTVMNGARMPVSVSHVYNSCDADKNDFFCGYGWRTNFHQTLHKELLDETIYYVYTDGDGTEHWFKPTTTAATKYKDESGMSMELVPGTESVTIRDKGDNILTFPLISATPTSSNPVTGKVLISSIADACGNTITVTSTGMKISQLTDGAGRVTTFIYSGNFLSKIKTPWHTDTVCVSFTYSSGCVSGITYEDGNGSAYAYQTEPGPDNSTYYLLTNASGPEGVTAAFSYTNTNALGGLPHVISETQVSGGTGTNLMTASHTSYVYGVNLCLVTDELTGKSLRYHFNENGNATGVDDGLGYAVFAEYDQSGENADAPINHPTSSSRIQRVVNNLLADGLLCKTSGSSWTKYGTGTVTQSIHGSGFGRYERKFTVSNNNTLYLRQTVSVTAGKTYTMSGYVQSLGAKAYLRVMAGNDTFESIPVELVGTETETELTRTQVTFKVPAGVSSISCDLVAKGTAQGTIAWWDSAQLEEGETANHVNLIENSRMKRTGSSGLPNCWTADSNCANYLSWQDGSACLNPMPENLHGDTMHVAGRFDRSVRVYQAMNVSGHKGDRLTVGGWASSYAKKTDTLNSIYCRLQVWFCSGNSTTWSDWHLGGIVDFNHEEGNWQFGCGNVTAPVDFNWIRVAIYYNKQMNFADFTNLFLYKEAYGSDYVYDAKGNRKSRTSSAGNTGKKTYDDYNNILTSAAPGRTVKTNYVWGSTEAEKRKHLLQSATTPLGTKTSYVYDDYGNPVQVKVEDSTGTLNKFIQTTATYTPDNAYAAGSYVETQTDARGKVVTTVTDPDKGTVTSVTDPSSQVVNNVYDLLRRPTKTSTMLNGQEVKTESAYDAQKGYLKTVKHNTITAASGDVTYRFVYDSLGRQTSVKVGNDAQTAVVLSTTTYDAIVRQVSEVVFGNNGKVHNSYDDFGRLTGVRFDNATTDRFTYAYDAQGRVAYLVDHERGVTVYTDYDLAGRPCKKTHLLGTDHAYTGELTYNEYELPHQFTEYVGASRVRYTTGFGYDNENRVTALTYGTGSMAYTYDKLGRITKRTVKPASTNIESTFTYVAGGHGTNSTTGLIQTITQNGVTLTYTYDNNGNITSVSDGTKITGYVYDAIGQLIRVNDQTDTTAGTNGTTWVFTYDLGGNILTKKAYAYTTGTVGTAVENHSYTYGNSDWKDKLTAYDGNTIQYDNIGNPTTDGTWTYTWEHGRQLKQMSKAGMTVAFKYNEDGLRTKKTVTDANSNVTATEYILHGKNIVHMTQGTDTLHFYYDAQGKPGIVIYNGTAYGYLYNLQGDVVALVDGTGTKIVEYTYDAWGKPIAKTGTLASTLGTVQPFRYRGYVFDGETGLYYLRSRYYNAVKGRFLNADSLFDGADLFTYCKNNPIAFADYNGNTAYEDYYRAIPISTFDIYSIEVYNNYSYFFRSALNLSVKSNISVDLNSIVKYNGNEYYNAYYVSEDESVIIGLIKAEVIDTTFYAESYWSLFGPPKTGRECFYLGSQGSYVRNLQICLNRYFYNTFNGDYNSIITYSFLSIDGIYGYETVKMVKKFQEENGLLVDGKAGEETLNCLWEWIKEDNRRG